MVTGGSSGIGLAIAKRFCELGYRVWLWGRDATAGEAAAAAIGTSSSGGTATFCACDVRSARSITDAVARFKTDHDRLDVLVNCAGIRRTIPVSTLDESGTADQINTILTGSILVTAALHDLLVKSEGLIVNIGSVAGRESFAKHAAYGAAKAGLIHFTRTAAKELFASRVRVICVCPGVVQTRMIPALEASFLRKALPRRRLQTVDEVAALVAELTAPAFASSTGNVIDLDDGVLLFPG